MQLSYRVFVLFFLTLGCVVCVQDASGAAEASLRGQLDAPLLFVQRPSYQGIHIYDTYYQWYPGGGIYVLENPWDPPEDHRVRAVIDANTPDGLGEGVYSDPDLSWDATRLLFCFKGEAQGSTSIYEIGLDGSGLRSLTSPESCEQSCGRYTNQHDVGPAYLPDGRIVFKSTRPNGLVPCNNTGVDIMHIMDADGGNVRRLSVNNVNEFDPCVMPDGRILHGRWEYVDKTALTQQTLWTIFPDGTQETALFGNNLVRPEAFLDARPVPGASHLIAATLARHNATPRGAVGYINTRVSKNAPKAIFNFDYPDAPTTDTGNSCEPWPLDENTVLFSGRPEGMEYNVLAMRNRQGIYEVIHQEEGIDCHSPIPIQAQPAPSQIAEQVEMTEETGRFFVQNIYQGLDGVEPGEVKWLRLLEETSRITASPGGGGTFNQQFLLSAALAFSVKNFLGVVPVEEDGSAFFEAPSGRALFLQALDGEGRMVQSMRTFVQAAPGVTRSCIGCHERKYDAPENKDNGLREAHLREAQKPKPESWGSGYVDYPSMVQPVFDTHCVSCHGGEKGFEAGLDLSGGWTEFFNISYENLVSRRENQMVASLIAGIDCMNGTALWSAQRFGPREHGSGAAPLAEVLVSGHEGRIPNLSRWERDLLMAWIDTNGLYYGTWDYAEHSPQVAAWTETKNALIQEMNAAGCMDCHQKGKDVQFENDWFNFQAPEQSRILRAPMAKAQDGGLGLCQDKKTEPGYKRVRLLVGGGYAHGVEPLAHYEKQGLQPEPNRTPAPVKSTFASAENPHYQAMLDTIRKGGREALSTPRIDMPGAQRVAGQSRHFLSPPIPNPLPALEITVENDGVVALSWERSARTIGLEAEVYRSNQPMLYPDPAKLLGETDGFSFVDKAAPVGSQYYAVVLHSERTKSAPIEATVDIDRVPPPPSPSALKAAQGFGHIRLSWKEESERPLRYHVYRAAEGSQSYERLTEQAVPQLWYRDGGVSPEQGYEYSVRSVSRRDMESAGTPAVFMRSPGSIDEAVFATAFSESPEALCFGGDTVMGTLHGPARMRDGVLDLRGGGHATFENRPELNLSNVFSMEIQVRLSKLDGMAVLAGHGAWSGAGWFLQKMGGGWRWYVGGLHCDGGQAVADTWIHLAATFDGNTLRLYQDGTLVAENTGTPSLAAWEGPLFLGQYSGGPSDAHQTKGKIKGFKIYQRVLQEEELTTLQAPRLAMNNTR
jgi:hypothetical protein